MRIIGLVFLLSGCLYGGGEEQGREDTSFHVEFVRWQAKLASGSDAGSGCVLINNKDSYAEELVVTAEPGDVVELTQTFHRFRSTSDAWSAHPSDDAYWCGKSGAERWSSVRNPACFEVSDPEDAPARCAGSSISLVEREVLPAGDYPDSPYVKDVDGFRLTLELGSRGWQCMKDCSGEAHVEFVVQ